MPGFRRCYTPEAVVFITCVTRERQPYLREQEDITLFWDVAKRVRSIRPYHLLAYVILPDHFHWLIRVEDQNVTFSDVMQSLKRNTTAEYIRCHKIDGNLQLWQSRFWDHIIRDERDLENHVHYIHRNPVKHGLVKNPEEWQFSSFLYWQQKGLYP